MDDVIGYATLTTALEHVIKAIETGDTDPKARRDHLRRAREARTQLVLWLSQEE